MADEIDPRYAPQFQRGFDATQHVAPPARRGPARLAGGPPPTAQRVPDPPPLTRVPEVAEPDADDAQAERASGPAPLTWWDWLLPAIGAGLILVALLLWGRLATDTSIYFGSGTSDQWELFLQQAGYTLPGPLLSAGILAVTGGIVLQAVRPRR
jgi:hypothetical protein